jgi:hypothetical protein
MYRTGKYLIYLLVDSKFRFGIHIRSETMRRITICLEEEIYMSLVDYAAREASSELVRLSISRAMRKIVQERLGELNLYPPQSIERLQRLLKKRERLSISTDNGQFPVQQSFPEILPLANH